MYTNTVENPNICEYDDFIEHVFMAPVQPKCTIAIISDEQLEDVKSLFKFLLDIVLSGVKILVPEGNIFDITSVNDNTVFKLNEYLRSMFFEIKLTKEYDPNYYVEIKKNDLPEEISRGAYYYLSLNKPISTERIKLTDYFAIFRDKEKNCYKIIIALL